MTAANVQVAGTALKRKAITFSYWNGTALTFCALGNVPLASGTATNVIFTLVTNGNNSVTLTYDVHGECVRQAWHAFAGNGQLLSVIESYDD